MDLVGARALVTGGSSGIGAATALALAAGGAAVKVTGRDAPSLQSVAARTGGAWLAADLAEPAEVDRVAAWAGPVDLLVNNAAIGWAGRFAEMDPGTAEAVVRVNLLAPVRLTLALVPGMLERGRGWIVNVSSVAGHVGVADEAVYAATKAALIGFSDSLRYDLAGTGVGVTVVSPGVVRTAFFDRRGKPYGRSFPRPIDPGRVARALVRGVRRGKPQVFVPRWMAFPVWFRGAWPSLYRALQQRFG